ncbi:MAG: glycosyltransferase family 2 protein [Pseudomonadota bacterium]
MKPAPDVSVIMAAWQASGFIEGAVRSVLAQKGVALELIVVDDASGDDTLRAAERAAAGDPRLVLDRLPVNSGPSAARNRAIALATGRYLAVVDCDDTLEPGRLARLVAFADETGADLVADNMNRVCEIGAAASQAFLDPDALVEPAAITLAEYLDPETEARFGENLGYLKPLFRAERISRLGDAYDVTLRNSEDYYLVARLLAEGAIFQLHPSQGYNYLVREGSISHRLTPELTQAILDADAAFAERYAPAFDNAARRAHARRRKALERSHSFECVVAALKARRLDQALRALARRPSALASTAATLTAIGWAKIGGGADQKNVATTQKATDQTAAQ